MLDSVVRLRIAVFGCLGTAGILGLWLTWIDGVQVNTPIVRTTLYFFLGTLSLSALFWLIGRYALRSASVRTRRRYYFVADFFALVAMTRYLFPLAMTVASYGLVPRSLALVDEWLSWPERMLGIIHPLVYQMCDSWGLLPTLALMYNLLWGEVIVILLWFALVRQDLTPLWQAAAAASIAGSVGLGAFWLAPAIGPWAHYGYAAYGHPPPSMEAAFLADFSALREGRFTALDAPQGLVTVPSFHVVFAILFTWVLRRERWLYPMAIALNAGVIAATFPVGWHYLADLPAGAIWAVGAIVVVRRIQGAPARQTSADDARPAARSDRVPNHRGRWSLRNLRSREST